jgi:hypothetical protein
MVGFYAFEFENDNFKGGYIMTEKNIKARVRQKSDTSENWAKALAFSPLVGEIIVYTDLNRMKIGDGTTNVNLLPFIDESLELITVDDIDAICGTIIQDTTASEVTF